MTHRTRLRWIWRTSIGGAASLGLVLTLASPAPAAQLISLELDAPNVTVTFRDTDPGDVSHEIVLTPQGPGATVRKVPLSGPVPGVNRTSVRMVNAGITPGIKYCARVSTVENNADNVFSARYESNEVCAEPKDSPTAPGDVSVVSIQGEANPPAGTNRNYWIHYTNTGADVKGVTMDVQLSGSLTLRRPPESGTFIGFQCSAAGSGFRCTGGTLPKGAKGQLPVLVSVKGPGPGAVHATVGVAGDPVPGNNAQTFTVLSVPRP
ncbi:hypothetical protein [Streptomyces sp. NPDC012888]|uniref:hypothetical protein n=1 Tax=Streptomyces sp. NPDC012888 TaxID=3364855 RepID=UPI00369A1A67